ncbi:mitogen-activated protein kinase kinase kinase 1-like isoform X2 [Eucalyptus grandis]|uniref:mitogen-activated protein kinase kinase kinase 1-like isoform X2 n=1 Tax=Eucalyptus grandis TaxID=71139 RepID=UPI00192EF713|nr:mitogen-activated protein kinase kinase kinase 1-like isoform X2 [Eucalyptus grandis]
MAERSAGSIGSSTASTIFYSCPSTIFHSCPSSEVNWSDIDDSDHSLSIAAENESEDEDDVGNTSTEDEESEDESEDEDDVGNTSTVINLEPSRLISSEGSFKEKITSWQKWGPLGKGSSVYEVNTDNGSFFAVKEVPLLDQGNQSNQNSLQLEQKIKLYRQLEHENIVRYIGTDKDNEKLYVFLELMPRGSLSTFYHKYGLRESQVSAYTRQILEGLKYLHDQNVIHRDIRCAKILVGASGSVKLTDIGMANVIKNGRNGSCGLAADIWSLGCTVLEMLTSKRPYSEFGDEQALEKIFMGVLPEIPEYLSRDAQDFIHKCLQVDPKDRPSAAQLLGHPFVRKPPTSAGSASPR